MAIDLEMSMKIQEWRTKALNGTLTLEESREAINVLRQGRVAAQVASTTSRTKTAAAKAPIDTKSLLEGLKAGNSLGTKL